VPPLGTLGTSDYTFPSSEVARKTCAHRSAGRKSCVTDFRDLPTVSLQECFIGRRSGTRE